MSSDVIIIIHDGGALGGGGPVTPPLPPGDFAVFADEPGSITSASGAVSAWGSLTQITSNERPLLVTDTVTGQQCISFAPGQTLALGDGAADFLSQVETYAIVVWRSRKWDPRLVYTILDTTAGGTTPGYQFAVSDDSTNNGKFRKERIRIRDGSSFVIDEPPTSGFYNNNFIEGKWIISVLHSSSATVDGSVDSEQAWSFDAVSLPSATPSPLVVGGAGYVDIACVYLKRGPLSAPVLSGIVSNLAARFIVPLIAQVAGSPTTAHYYAFPCLTTLPGGLLACCYRSGLNHSGDIGTIDMQLSSDLGVGWGVPRTIQSDPSFDSRDACISRRLSNGSYLLNYFLQTLGAHGHETAWVRSSADNLASFGAPVRVTVGVIMGTTGFEACSAPPVEISNGKVLFPLYGQNDGDAHTSAWIVSSSDLGVTWPTNIKVADGIADGISYSELDVIQIHTAHQGLNVDDLFGLVRDDTNSHMWELHSTDLGVTWAAKVAVLGAKSSGRSLMQAADGSIYWVGRPNDPQATILTRNAAGDWTIPQSALVLGAIDAGMTNGDMVETSPGVFSVVYSREIRAFGPDFGPGTADVVCRPSIPQWMIRAPMQLPMVVTPATANVTVSNTLQISANGARPFTYPFGSNESGAAAVAASGLYTAGASNGTDVVNVTDVNGQVKTVTITVTGSVAPSVPPAANRTAWFDPRTGFTFDGGGHIATWTALEGIVANGGGSPAPDSTTRNGKAAIRVNTGAFTLAAITISDLFGTSDWVFACGFEDTGSPAFNASIYFFNAAIISSGNDGNLAIGTSADTAYVGQDGGATDYDSVVFGTGLHTLMCKYVAGTGKIHMSLDGAAFDAGVSVGPIGASVSVPTIGKSVVINVNMVGYLTHLVTYNGPTDETALQAFISTTI